MKVWSIFFFEECRLFTLAVLGLLHGCAARAPVVESGSPSLVVVCRLLTAVASLAG